MVMVKLPASSLDTCVVILLGEAQRLATEQDAESLEIVMRDVLPPLAAKASVWAQGLAADAAREFGFDTMLTPAVA
jgi:hypothetical protein